MISVTQTSELTFSVQFDEAARDALSELSANGSVETLFQAFLLEAVLISSNWPDRDYEPGDDDFPF